jgi:hypothetical protein
MKINHLLCDDVIYIWNMFRKREISGTEPEELPPCRWNGCGSRLSISENLDIWKSIF